MGSYCEINRDNITGSSIYPNRNQTTTNVPSLTTTQIGRNLRRKFKNFLVLDNQICEPNPCLNDGVCKVTEKSYGLTFECQCASQFFTGQFCEKFSFLSPTDSETSTSTTEAVKNFNIGCPSNCMYEAGHGFCTFASSTSKSPKCVCNNEWTGSDCAERNYCIENNCINNSTCLNYPEMQSYLCQCQSGYSGRLCELEEVTTTTTTRSPFVKNICLAERCQNNGKCVMLFSNPQNRFTFECEYNFIIFYIIVMELILRKIYAVNILQ